MCFKKNDGHFFFFGMVGDGLTNLINECVGAAFYFKFHKKNSTKISF